MSALHVTAPDQSRGHRRLDASEINGLIRKGLEALDPDHPIAFFCECARANCSGTVLLTGPEYDAGRSGRHWNVLAAGHRSPR